MAKPLTKEQVIQQFKQIHGKKYSYSLVHYKNDRTKIKIKCKKHGLFEMQPNSHKNGQGCPQCGREKIVEKLKERILTNKEYIFKLEKIHGKNYFDYSELKYDGAFKPVILICKKCNKKLKSTASDFYKVKGCKYCTKNDKRSNSLTNEEFIEKSNKIHYNKYNYSLVNYISRNKKIQIICPEHGLFEQKGNEHLSGCGCPKCNTSRGEEIILNYLKENNINFIYQYKVQINNSNHYYDFFLLEKKLIIEFNGKQHYEPIKFFGGRKGFEFLKERDIIKDNYCKQNNIKLIRIPYWELNNIEQILKDKIK